MATLLEKVEKQWKICLAKERFLADKDLIAEAKHNPDLKPTLLGFMKAQKFNDDDLVLFNWFIAVCFGTSLNELKL